MSSEDSSKTECVRGVQDFAARAFSDWAGLPVGCPIEEAIRRLGPAPTFEARGQVGEQEAWFRVATVEGYRDPVRVWHDADGLVLLLDGAPLELTTPVAGLPEPEARLDYRWHTLVIPGGEWVYPPRGLALFLNTDGTRAVHVAVFPPTTANDYLVRYRLHLGEHRLPARRW